MPNQRFGFFTIRCGRCAVSVSAILCLVIFSGCGGDPNLGDVSGKITLNGEPLEGAYVTFTPTKSDGIGTSTYAKTAGDGTYRMMASDNKVGAYIGENLVRIKTGVLKRDGSGVTEEIVPSIYNSNSELRLEVKRGANPHDFQLESTASSEINQKVDIDR